MQPVPLVHLLRFSTSRSHDLGRARTWQLRSSRSSGGVSPELASRQTNGHHGHATGFPSSYRILRGHWKDPERLEASQNLHLGARSLEIFHGLPESQANPTFPLALRLCLVEAAGVACVLLKSDGSCRKTDECLGGPCSEDIRGDTCSLRYLTVKIIH